MWYNAYIQSLYFHFIHQQTRKSASEGKIRTRAMVKGEHDKKMTLIEAKAKSRQRMVKDPMTVVKDIYANVSIHYVSQTADIYLITFRHSVQLALLEEKLALFTMNRWLFIAVCGMVCIQNVQNASHL